MGGFVRSLGAVIVGLAVGLLIILVSEAVGNLIYPWPANLQPGDMDALRAHVASLPLGAFLFVLGAWAIGTLAGTWTAGRFARRSPMLHAAVVGFLLFVLALAMMLTSAHPAWFWIAAIGVYVVSTLTGGRLAAGGSV